ncbi:MAG: hypothetical protein AAF745_15660, partial [Planctomycetota bacterium]
MKLFVIGCRSTAFEIQEAAQCQGIESGGGPVDVPCDVLRVCPDAEFQDEPGTACWDDVAQVDATQARFILSMARQERRLFY